MMMSENDSCYGSRVAEVADYIKGFGEIWILIHEDPDGDAYGSSMGLLLALKALGKNARAFSQCPVPRMYEKMESLALLERAPDLPDDMPELIIVLDNGDFDRIGEPYATGLKSRGVIPHSVANRPRIVNIDHHVSNTMYGDVNLVCPECSAAGVIVHDLVNALGCEYSPEIATPIYIALITDTGRFSFSNTNRRALEVAGELVSLGVSPAKVIEDIYYTRTAGQMKLFGLIMCNLTEVPELGVLYAWQTKAMLEETGTQPSDTEGVVDLLRTIGDYPVSIFFKENAHGIKVSLRSKSEFNAADFAVQFGGGGHHGAAGFKVEGTISEAVEAVLGKFRELTV